MLKCHSKFTKNLWKQWQILQFFVISQKIWDIGFLLSPARNMEGTNEPSDQQTNQPINQPTNQLMNQPRNKMLCQSNFTNNLKTVTNSSDVCHSSRIWDIAFLLSLARRKEPTSHQTSKPTNQSRNKMLSVKVSERTWKQRQILDIFVASPRIRAIAFLLSLAIRNEGTNKVTN